MSFGNEVTVVGNITRDPELRYTPSGASVASFGVAWNRKYTKDGQDHEQVSFFDVTCWATLGENCAASLRKGSRVVVTGRLEQQSWESPSGEKRSKIVIVADDVGPSLRWATAEVTGNPRTGGSDGFSAAPKAAPQAAPANYDQKPF